ncbi:GNAT family N-acetyltransferase [Caproicibacter fermentans]|uniref:GNAT family N-acetyltransferase n=1 Tax=Caproicibacter fermentans TaxID=2576756 RepID=A0A7G8TDI4_9FIRM|nr:GNAT family N-acetyltransferase [Caproicibacter fermentans]
MVGSVDFKAPPDQNGEVEIGYGLGNKYEHHGYMTEAVQAMCEWTFKQESVKHVTAETETGNLPSQKVLTRCGFKLFRQGETYWWKR